MPCLRKRNVEQGSAAELAGGIPARAKYVISGGNCRWLTFRQTLSFQSFQKCPRFTGLGSVTTLVNHQLQPAAGNVRLAISHKQLGDFEIELRDVRVSVGGNCRASTCGHDIRSAVAGGRLSKRH